jgi:ATP synthase protein I
MTTRGAKKTIQKIFLIQFVLTLGAAGVSLVLADIKAGYSAVIGGGINILATAYFANKVFSAGPGSTARQIARAFYWGEVVKILLTGILFTGVLLWLDVAFLPLFLTYAITMMAFWLALVFTL